MEYTEVHPENKLIKHPEREWHWNGAFTFKYGADTALCEYAVSPCKHPEDDNYGMIKACILTKRGNVKRMILNMHAPFGPDIQEFPAEAFGFVKQDIEESGVSNTWAVCLD